MSNITSYRLSITKSNAFTPLGMTEIGHVDKAGYRQVGGSGICKRMHIILPNLINSVVVVSCLKFRSTDSGNHSYCPQVYPPRRPSLKNQYLMQCGYSHPPHPTNIFEGGGSLHFASCIIPHFIISHLVCFPFVNDATHSHL